MGKSDPPSSDRAVLWRGKDGEGGSVLIKVESRNRQPSKQMIQAKPQNGNPKDAKSPSDFLSILSPARVGNSKFLDAII